MWWRDTLHAQLAPERLGYRVHRPLRRAAMAVGVVDCVGSGAGRPAWAGACSALKDLVERAPPRRLRLDVVVSDRLVRYQVLPWREGIVSRKEWQAYARHSLHAVFGEASKSWWVHVEPVPPGGTALACAVDGALIESLRSTAADAARLVAVRPNFLSVFARRRGLLRGPRFWFAAVEANHVALGVSIGGRWRVLRNESVADGWRAALPGLIRRVQVALPDPCLAPLYLDGAHDGSDLPDLIEGLPVKRLDPAAGAEARPQARN